MANMTGPAKRGEMKRKLRVFVWQSLFVVPLLLAWWLAPSALGISPLIFPSLDKVIVQAKHVFIEQELIDHALLSVKEIGSAFAIAAVVGVTLGLTIGMNKRLRLVVTPILSALFAVPLIVLIPLFLVTLGLGAPSKIAFGALYGVFPIVFNTVSGVASLDGVYVRLAKAYGLKTSFSLRRIVLPAASPQIFNGLQLSLAITIVAVISAEMFGSIAGLGFLIQRSAQRLDSASLWFTVLMTLILSWLMLNLIRNIARMMKVEVEAIPH